MDATIKVRKNFLFQTQLCQSKVTALSLALAPHPPLANVTTHTNMSAEKNGRTLSNLTFYQPSQHKTAS